MGQHNQTRIIEVVLLGFSGEQSINLCIFAVFLFVYLITIAGNTLIIIIILIDPRLNTPMYFFLFNLSFLDICYTTSMVPQLLIHLWTNHKTISFNCCMTQLYIALSLAGTEFLLLAAMAYDRYVAVCHPLHYMVIMNRRKCIQIALATWMGGFLNAVVQTVITMNLHFNCFNSINHFTCEILVVIKLACSFTFINHIIFLVAGVIMLMIPFIVVMLSYMYIISAILHIRSSEGRKRAFSTCSSHLTVVSLCFGTVIFAYGRPRANTSPNQDKILTVIYSVLTPMLNPIIYSLRNKEVKRALSNVVRKAFFLKKK
ncbi:olfactory receptor-like protein OLF3 [Tiliqua scincoides]|uniref:olfactory receptor-like protein OLF3 n=1 Tax=Tiliqua scincoides TaxID=71010 RepID=UPI003462CC11